MRPTLHAALAAFIPLLLTAGAARAEMAVVPLTFTASRIDPATLSVPADARFKLHIRNQESRLEMFESYDLNRKIAIAPGRTIDIFIGPLKAGDYRFFGRNAPAATQGLLVAQ